MPSKRVIASAILALILTSPQVSSAEGRTGHTFTGWSEAVQDSFIDISVSMAGIVATQTKPEVARCIDEWYFSDTAIKAQRDDELRHTIQQNLDFHPGAVILASLIKACGSFS